MERRGEDLNDKPNLAQNEIDQHRKKKTGCLRTTQAIRAQALISPSTNKTL